MANQFTMLALTNAFLLLDVVVAMPWLGAMETPVGIEAAYAISPRPTEAPGLNGLPRELLKRSALPFPPPSSWCGFVGGDSDNILSCGPSFTCDYRSTAFGCCSNDVRYCTNLFTTCLNSAQYSNSCDSSCLSDPLIIKCSETASPYCGVYSFAGDSFLYNCQEVPLSTQAVEFIRSWYATGSVTTIDSTSIDSSSSGAPTPTFSLDPSTSSESSSQTQSSSGGFAGPTGGSRATGSSFGSTTDGPSNNPAQTTEASSHHGIAAGAIGGIVAGVGILALGAAILTFLCIRKRNTRRAAEAQNAQPRPPATFNPGQQPMQQQQQNALGVPVGGYQNQQPSELQSGQQQNGYTYPHSPVSTHATPAGYPSSPTQSQFQNQNFEHRASTVTSTNPFSPVPSTISTSDNHNNGTSEGGFFHPSPSPTPALPEADSKTGKTDMMQSQQQPQISEVHGSTIVNQGPPIQTQHPYTQGQPTYNQNQQPYTTQTQQSHTNSYTHEMPGAVPHHGPWELSNRE